MVPNNKKRKEIRVEANLPLLISKIYIQDDKIANLNKVLPMKMINLSVSGVLLCSNLDIPPYVKLILNLYLDKDEVSCFADIIRKEKRDDEYYYGCNLSVTSEEDKSKIRKYVFKKQVADRANRKIN